MDKPCPHCGNPTCIDDDVHWWWCTNPRCTESDHNGTKYIEYRRELYYVRKLKEQYGDD